MTMGGGNDDDNYDDTRDRGLRNERRLGKIEARLELLEAFEAQLKDPDYFSKGTHIRLTNIERELAELRVKAILFNESITSDIIRKRDVLLRNTTIYTATVATVAGTVVAVILKLLGI